MENGVRMGVSDLVKFENEAGERKRGLFVPNRSVCDAKQNELFVNFVFFSCVLVNMVTTGEEQMLEKDF